MTAASPKLLLGRFQLSDYRIEAADRMLTPALAIYPEIVDSNIDATLKLLAGNVDRWRPHVKTAKLGWIMRHLVELGIANFKCSTTLELMTVCDAGAADVLLAYPAVGANATRVRDLAARFAQVRISALVENDDQLSCWTNSNVGLFIDVNPGMDRTGVEQHRIDYVTSLAESIQRAGLAFRGLHYYDGHLSRFDLPERTEVAHRGYDRLLEIVASLEERGIPVNEVVTAGTPAFPCSISHRGLSGGSFVHRVSPGTIIYCDCTSLSQLPEEYGYRPAALVLSTVVSAPNSQRITCDAGHKTVSADAGVPTCAVLGHDELVPARPSEEHLPIGASPDHPKPSIGETLYLVPMHVCPTVNNFDCALMVSNGKVIAVERVTARGREAPTILSK